MSATKLADRILTALHLSTTAEIEGGLVMHASVKLNAETTVWYHVRLGDDGCLSVGPRGGLPVEGGCDTPAQVALDHHDLIEKVVVGLCMRHTPLRVVGLAQALFSGINPDATAGGGAARATHATRDAGPHATRDAGNATRRAAGGPT